MSEINVTAFEGAKRVAAGPLSIVSRTVRPHAKAGFRILMFNDATGGQVDVDLRDEATAEPAAPAKAAGRPRLGVVAREVTLLPRHWEWLAAQPGGASVSLRKLVEEAARSPAAAVKAAQTAAYRFMTAMAGNLPGYEEANRALFAADEGRFQQFTQGWPADVRDYAWTLAGPVFPDRG